MVIKLICFVYFLKLNAANDFACNNIKLKMKDSFL